MDKIDITLRLVDETDLSDEDIDLLVRYISYNPTMGLIDQIPKIDQEQKEKLRQFVIYLAGGSKVFQIDPPELVRLHVLSGIIRRAIRERKSLDELTIVGKDEQEVILLRSKARYNLLRAAGLIIEPEEDL